MTTRTARIIDVNLNRLLEGLKVIEDITRLGLDNKVLLRSVRALRNRVGRDTRSLRHSVLSARDSEQDPGRGDRFDRLRRRNLADVLAANFRRTQESSRVLEELLKVEAPALSPKLKSVRFRLYDLEKKALQAAERDVL
ncbi:MAG: thiamine-phosphate pyrophosphorylase [candidate division WOR-3 bacterium]|nr:MAG: thiamine-phosphate pyrophosphorylase [candidate division WOR-3 bacterium]